MDFSVLEKNIGYKFKNENLLINAMTHSSAMNEHKNTSNQRLEFLGDAVLQIIISDHLYVSLPSENEGSLSKLRSLIVCTDSLHVASMPLELNQYLILGRGELLSGGRDKKNIIADAYESVVGAIYLDGGYENARDFVMRSLSDIITKAMSGRLTYDYKTTLQEYVQANIQKPLSYELVKVEGPEHDQTFYSRAVIGEIFYETASGHSRKQSEQSAANRALKALGVID
ncbi:MAG: ribonuclease III [Anaerofustis stercorihominis]|nr:ribonuclease III [Anaerofustis stercorihominis]